MFNFNVIGVLLLLLTVQTSSKSISACSGPNCVHVNSPRSSKLDSAPCDNGIIIKRSCTYEECLKYRYPNIAICRRWDEIEWSEKVEVCHKLVNTPCNEF